MVLRKDHISPSVAHTNREYNSHFRTLVNCYVVDLPCKVKNVNFPEPSEERLKYTDQKIHSYLQFAKLNLCIRKYIQTV